VRSPLVLIVFSLTSVYGQVQQQSLIDRLLRPNMDLQNSAQGKTFDLNAYAIERRPGICREASTKREIIYGYALIGGAGISVTFISK
jgi:hypothetical protein